MKKILVCGASGYVGRHLVEALARNPENEVHAASSRHLSQWPKLPPQVKRYPVDLKNPGAARAVVEGMDHVYNLATAVGGIGFVESNEASSMVNVLINTNLLRAAAVSGVERFFFASSSCVYPGHIDAPLKESDAYPANPMGGYGWEKLFSERMCLAFAQERGVACSIARYHGIYGPNDFRPDGRDHVATALAIKIVRAKLSNNPLVEIWGDGSQTRSLLYIDDCVEGTIHMMEKGVSGPLNLAHPAPVSVNGILRGLEEIAAFPTVRKYDLSKPTGRQNKTSDNTNLREQLGWEPSTPHMTGFLRLYNSVWQREIIK